MLKLKIGEWRRDLYSPNHRTDLAIELAGFLFYTPITVPELATEEQREAAIKSATGVFTKRLQGLRDALTRELGPTSFRDRMDQRSAGIEKRDDGE